MSNYENKRVLENLHEALRQLGYGTHVVLGTLLDVCSAEQIQNVTDTLLQGGTSLEAQQRIQDDGKKTLALAMRHMVGPDTQFVVYGTGEQPETYMTPDSAANAFFRRLARYGDAKAILQNEDGENLYFFNISHGGAQ